MTNQHIMSIAMRQSALDLNADISDFTKEENVFVKSGLGALARKYYSEPIACNLVSYGSNIVASVKEEYKEMVKEYLSKFEFYHCFETPNMHWLDERMREQGQRVCFMENIFCRMSIPSKDYHANMSLRCLRRKTLTVYICLYGVMLCVMREKSWMFLVLAHMIMEN